MDRSKKMKVSFDIEEDFYWKIKRFSTANHIKLRKLIKDSLAEYMGEFEETEKN